MEGEQNLRRTAILGAVASIAIVAGIIVALWLLFFRKSDTSTSKDNAGTSQQAQTQSGNTSGSGKSSQTSGTAATGSSTTPSNPSTGAAKNGQNLAATGPKETIAVFVSASAVGTAGYYVYTKRRLAQN